MKRLSPQLKVTTSVSFTICSTSTGSQQPTCGSFGSAGAAAAAAASSSSSHAFRLHLRPEGSSVRQRGERGKKEGRRDGRTDGRTASQPASHRKEEGGKRTRGAQTQQAKGLVARAGGGGGLRYGLSPPPPSPEEGFSACGAELAGFFPLLCRPSEAGVM